MLASAAAKMTLEACTAIRPPTSTLDRTTGTTHARVRGSLPNVFVPDVGVDVDERLKEVRAFVGVQVDDGHARVGSQPLDPTLERPRLAHHDRAYPELPDQPA